MEPEGKPTSGRMVDERPLDKIPREELIKMVEDLRARRSVARERRATKPGGTKTPRVKKSRTEENAPDLDAFMEEQLGDEFLAQQ